jgi:hypothetical protein
MQDHEKASGKAEPMLYINTYIKGRMPSMFLHAELQVTTNFSFLRGASHPEELVERAARLGYSALAVTDECSLAGVVRAHVAAKEHGIKLIVGAELRLKSVRSEERGVRSGTPRLGPPPLARRRQQAHPPGRENGGRELGPSLLTPHSPLGIVLLATDRTGYGNLSELITRAAPLEEGEYHLTTADLTTACRLSRAGCRERADIGHARWLGSRSRDAGSQPSCCSAPTTARAWSSWNAMRRTPACRW